MKWQQVVLGAYIDDMKIMPAFDDAPDFVKQVEQVVNGIIHRHSPEIVVLLKIDNWFGSNWLGFSGKLLGALGIWSEPYNQSADNIRIPPFVPSRVVSQRRFVGPSYEEIDGGKPIHERIASRFALRRKLLPPRQRRHSSGTAAIPRRLDAEHWWRMLRRQGGTGPVMPP